MFEYLDARRYIIPITKGAYVYYGYYGGPSSCRWIVPGTYAEDQWET